MKVGIGIPNSIPGATDTTGLFTNVLLGPTRR